MVRKASTWSISASAGGNYPGADPVFFKDRQRIAIVTALAIKTYQLTTKQMIAKIPVDCTDVAQLYLSSDESRFYLVRTSGALDYVDVTGNEVIRVQTIDKSVKVLRIVDDVQSKISLIVENPNGEGLQLMFWNGESELEVADSAEHADIFAVSPSRDYVAFAGRKEGSEITTYEISTGVIDIKGVRARRSHILAVSNAGLVAVGSPSGVIDLYYPKGVRALKWHLEEVDALQFTLNDEYLLSGGKERVLVLWQLGTDKQQFLPRLDGPITSICCNSTSTLYGATLGNHQLVVLSAVDLVSRLHVSGIRARYEKGLALTDKKSKKKQKKDGPAAVGDCTASLTVHPGSRHAYILAGGSQVQVYNPAKDEQESVIALAPSLQTGRVRREHRVVDPKTTHLEFTADGVWMVTVDVLEAPGVDQLLSRHDMETQLKFWKRIEDRWTLVTRISQPHGTDKQVTALRPAANGHEILTAGNDGGLRLWKLDSKTGQWSLRRVLSGFALTTGAVALDWALDGSLIAVGFGLGIFLVDAKRLKVVKELPNIAGSRIRAVKFVGQRIVILSKTRLSVFDVVADALLWSIKVLSAAHDERLLAADPEHGRFAIALNFWMPGNRPASRLVLFETSSPIPLELTIHSSPMSALRIVPGTSSYMCLDRRGVISSLAGTTTVLQSAAPSFASTLVSMNAAAVQSSSEAQDVEGDDAVTRQLDVNSFNKVFDSDVINLEAMFDRVLSLVSPANLSA